MIDLFGYSNVALQFSGGKDSLACLYLLKDQLEKVVVYYLDTGDGCPETHDVIDKVKSWIPRFITIKSDLSSVCARVNSAFSKIAAMRSLSDSFIWHP